MLDALAALAGAVDELDVPPVGEAIEEVLSLRDRLEAKLSVALRAFGASEAWRSDGSLSLTELVKHFETRTYEAF